jgi:hypothetical protein
MQSPPPKKKSSVYIKDENGNYHKIENPRDSNIMVGLGKTGLGVAGTLGVAGLAEGGRSTYNLYKAGKETQGLVSDLKGVKGDFKKRLSKGISTTIAGQDPKTRSIINEVVKPMTNKAVNVGSESAQKGWKFWKSLKHSPISKAQLGWNYWNKLSSLPRIALLNSETLGKIGINQVKKNINGITAQETKVLERVPKVLGRLGKSGIALKNSKGLLGAAATLGGVSGLTYVNGRGLQNN